MNACRGAALAAVALAACTPEAGSAPPEEATACELARQQDLPASVCIGERRGNWRVAFAYPAEAARIAPLVALLRARAAEERAAFADMRDEAAEHPDHDLWHETAYRLDADVPGLVGLSYALSEYGGGAHPYHESGALIWDRAGQRPISLAEVFAEPAAAEDEIERVLCPVLAEARRRNGRRVDPAALGCLGGLDGLGLVEGDGGRVDALTARFDYLDGYAGGYSVRVPVTPRLLGLIAEPWRASFEAGTSAAIACGSADGWDCE